MDLNFDMLAQALQKYLLLDPESVNASPGSFNFLFLVEERYLVYCCSDTVRCNVQ